MNNNTAIIDGTIEKIYDERHVSERFNVREVVIFTGGQYPESIKCQMVNSKCDLIIGLKVGDKVLAHVNIKGRKAVNKQGETTYFNSLEIWKLEK